MSTPEPRTLNAIRKALRAAGFAEHDPSDPNPEGFDAGWSAFGTEIIVDLCGFDLLPFSPGEGPRALLDGYVQALDRAGYSVRLAGTTVIVSGAKAVPAPVNLSPEEIGAKRAVELFANAGDENWLGVR